MEITIRIDDDIRSGAEALFKRFGSAAECMNQLVRDAIDTTTADEYFTPRILAEIEESDRQIARGEILRVSIDELISMESGPVPERIINEMKKLGWSTEGIGA
jgi:hypothetical protein